MGGTWLPDPSIGSSFSDDVSFPSVVMIDSDNEDADIIDNERERIINYNEYHLLNNDDNLPDWEENSNSDTEDSEEEHITSDANPSDPSPICDNDSEPTENTHRDIAVDFEQVKAAMTRVTLPPSATPSWATSIPDSEWRSYLQNRILSMQERPNILKESETTPK